MRRAVAMGLVVASFPIWAWAFPPEPMREFSCSVWPTVYNGWPDVSGDRVVWTENMSGYRLRWLDLNTGNSYLVPPSPGQKVLQTHPRISGDIVVWMGSYSREDRYLYARDLSTGQDWTIDNLGQASTTSVNEWDIDENLVVWTKGSGQTEDLYGMYLDDAAASPFLICGLPTQTRRPRVAGDMVVWYEIEMHGATGDIRGAYGKNVRTGQEYQFSYLGYEPSVSAETVVWTDGVGIHSNIMGKDLTTGQEFIVCQRGQNQHWPEISGSLVGWVEFDTSPDWNYDLYAKDLGTGEVFTLRETEVDVWSFAMDGRTFVWSDDRSGTENVYGMVVPEPAALSLLALGGLAAVRRRRGARWQN